MDAERENGYSCDSGDTIDGRIVRYAIGADGTIGAMEEITPGSVSEVTGIGQEQIRQGDSLEYGFSGISTSRRTPGLVIASMIVKDDGDSIFLSEDYGTTWKQILFDLVSGRASGGGERAQEVRLFDKAKAGDAIVIDFFHWTRQGDFKFGRETGRIRMQW